MIALLVLCVVFEAFFSGAEVAFISVNRAQLRHLVDKGSSKATALHQLLERPEVLFGTTLVGTNLCVVTFNALATLYVTDAFGPQYALYTVLVSAPVVLLFGEAIPKTIFQRHANRLAPHLVFPVRAITLLFRPIVYLLAKIAAVSANVLGVPSGRRGPLFTREELKLVNRPSSLRASGKDAKRRIIDRIFSFSERTAGEIMIPLVDLIAVPESSTIEAASRVMRASGYSRIPVFAGRIYDIVGWVNQYDLLLESQTSRLIKGVMRPIRYVPETMHLDRLFFTMQRAGDSLVVAIDEYGGAVGLITMEDVLEEVMGDIEDEYDVSSGYVLDQSRSKLLVNARIPLAQLADILKIRFPSGDFETLAGFLLDRFQKVPEVSEELRYRGYRFVVRKASGRTVDEVEISEVKES